MKEEYDYEDEYEEEEYDEENYDKYVGYIILNKTKKQSDPAEYQYAFGYSGTNKFHAQILCEKHLASFKKDRIHNIMKVTYQWVDGSKVLSEYARSARGL